MDTSPPLTDQPPAGAVDSELIDGASAAEIARRAGEESYRGLFDHLTELVYIQDLDGTFIDVNEAVLRSYGYSREELIGQTPVMLGAPGLVDLEELRRHLERAVAGEPQRFDWWGRRKDGSIFPKEVTLKRSTYFGRDVVLAVARDISERIAAEDALRRSEEHFRRLIEHASDLISILGPDGTVRYESPAITRMVGYEPDELMGHNAFDYICPEDVAPTLELFQRVMENPGSTVAAEFRFRHKDGSWVHMESVGRTLDPHSPDAGVVVNSRDITARKQAEAALRESEALKRAIVDGALDAVLSVDGDGRILEFNPAAERVLARRAADVIGQSAEILIPERYRDAFRAGLEAFKATGAADSIGRRVDVRALRGDGSEFPAEVAINAVQLGDGGVVFTAFLRDVTEQRAAQEALKQSEEHFRRLIENSSDVAVILGPDGTILYQSPAIARVLGYPAEVMGGRTAYENMHAEDIPQVQAAVAELLANPGTILTMPFRYRHMDGSWRVLECIGRTLLPDSADAGIVVNARDVTERVDAERQLQLQKSMLEAQGESSIDGIIVIADDGRLVWHNARFTEMWGLDESHFGDGQVGILREALMTRVADPEGFLERVNDYYAHPRESGRDELVLADGRTFDRYTSPLSGPNDDYYGRIWFFRDITETKRHAAELEAARADAEAARERASEYASSLEKSLEDLRAAQLRLVQQEKMASLGRLTAGIAHEIRNPINFVSNFAQSTVALVEELRGAIDGGDRELVDEVLADIALNAQKIQEHGLRADSIVRGMMDHARAGQAESAQPRQELDLHFLLDQHVASLLEGRADDGPIRFEREYCAEDACVSAVQADIDRVIRALLANAIEALDARARRDAGFEGVIRVESQRGAHTLTVTIADNGDGVPEDVRPRVFEPFFTTKPSGSGHTGLGLSLAHETVVAGYGGWMDVESEPGQGARFSFSIPT